jgi:hypothetical protein
MKRILHILRKNDLLATNIILQQSKEDDIAVVLIQEAILVQLEGVPVFVLTDDLESNDNRVFSYKDLIEKLFWADSVVTW